VNCETAYFDDNRFDFEDVIHVCGDTPCLLLAYNKEQIHVYFRIPKVHCNTIKYKLLNKTVYTLLFIFYSRDFWKMKCG